MALANNMYNTVKDTAESIYNTGKWLVTPNHSMSDSDREELVWKGLALGVATLALHHFGLIATHNALLGYGFASSLALAGMTTLPIFTVTAYAIVAFVAIKVLVSLGIALANAPAPNVVFVLPL